MNRSSRRRTQQCPVPGYRCKRRTRCNKTERRCRISSEPTKKFPRRCNNGSRRQKEGDGCAETDSTKYERCKNGTRRHKRSHECDAGVVYLFKNRRRILAKGQHLGRTDKSANANVKQHKRFSFAPDAPGVAEYRERKQKEHVQNEWDGPPSPGPPPKPPRQPDENLANPFQIHARKYSSSLEPEDDTGQEGFDHGDYNEHEERQQLSPIEEEEEEEEDEDNISSPLPRPRPVAQKKSHNTRSSSQRTRSERAKFNVDYNDNRNSRKSRKQQF